MRVHLGVLQYCVDGGSIGQREEAGVAELSGTDGVVALRAPVVTDVGEFRALWLDADSGFAHWFDPGRTPEASVDRVDEVLAELASGAGGRYGISAFVVDAVTGAIVGHTNVVPNGERSFEVCYLIAGSRRGEGLASRTLTLVSAAVLDPSSGFGADRIEAIIERRKTASQAVARNAGFEFRGARSMPAPLAPGGSVDDLVYVRES